MKDEIVLHETLGLNARMSICTNCGEDGDELVLMGIKNHKDICDSCGLVHYGGAPKRKCQKCGHSCTRKQLKDGERVPSTQPCNKCQEQMKEVDTELAKGGVAFKCSDCGTEGVIKHDHPFCAGFRKEHNTPPPEPIGVEFNKTNCPNCGGR